MKYDSIVDVLEWLPKYMTKKSFMYFALSSHDSVMGQGYTALGDPIDGRYGCLSDEMQHRFSLFVPVCLFSIDEVEKMMSKTHFKKEKLYSTTFGNIKGFYKL